MPKRPTIDPVQMVMMDMFPNMYKSVMSGHVPADLQPIVPTRSFGSQLKYIAWDRWANAQQAHAIRKGLELAYVTAQRRALEAQEQDTVINPTVDFWSGGNSMQGVRDPTGVTFSKLRELASDCEPAACIINTRIGQVSAFAQKAEYHKAHAKSPGFRIRLTNAEDKATDADKARIAELEQFLLETGYCPPPEDERPEGWEPGFEPFLKQLTRDRLTLDWVAVRKWKSAEDPKRYPIVAFTCVDAGVIRRVKKNIVGLKGHRLQFEDYEHERSNVKDGAVKFVKLEYEGGRKLEEYTAEEMFCARSRPRTDQKANGYGFSELEEAINCISGWVSCRDYNLFRFDKDSLPRGVMSILAQLNQQQFDSFTMMWRQMFEGKGKRWSIPILRGSPQAGSAVTWTPFDLSNREMEYSQFLFTIAIWLHAIYQIHPDETGFSAASPFRPPLSESSPEVDLEASQDKGLTPLLRWIAGLINREIIWKLDQTKRYMFEFVGTGHWDEAQDTEVRGQRLSFGLTTPRMEWNELDQTIPEVIADHPAWDLPMPFAQGVQLLQSLQQAQQQQEMAQQQQQEQLQQQTIAAHNANQFADRGEGDEDEQRLAVAGGGRPGEMPQMPSMPKQKPTSPLAKSMSFTSVVIRGLRR